MDSRVIRGYKFIVMYCHVSCHKAVMKVLAHSVIDLVGYFNLELCMLASVDLQLQRQTPIHRVML